MNVQSGRVLFPGGKEGKEKERAVQRQSITFQGPRDILSSSRPPKVFTFPQHRASSWRPSIQTMTNGGSFLFKL